MRIAILNWRDLTNPNAGGAEVFVHEVAGRFQTQGHEVSILSSKFSGAPRAEVVDGVLVRRVGSLKSGRHHFLAPRAAKAQDPDVVLESVNTIPYLLPARRHFPPFLTLVHQMAVDIWDSHLPRPLSGIARGIEPLLFRPYRHARVVAVSASTASDLINAGIRSPGLIPQGGIGAQEGASKESTPTIIFVGRLTSNKRPDHAVEAFRHIQESLPEARLWMVGEGPMSESLGRSLPPGAELLGRLDRAELLDRMARAHLLIVTSVREGWGLVVSEANALGTPAVAYDVPGLRDSINDGLTGLLAGPIPTEIADACLRLLGDQSVYDCMRERASHWGASHTWAETAASLMGLLDDCRHLPVGTAE